MNIGDEIEYQGYPATVTEQRGEYLFDLLVRGPNHEGEDPHIVRCVDFTAGRRETTTKG